MEAFLEALVTLVRRSGNKASIALVTIVAIMVMVTIWYVTFRAA